MSYVACEMEEIGVMCNVSYSLQKVSFMYFFLLLEPSVVQLGFSFLVFEGLPLH
jgi:hypothetical protein